MFSLADKLEHFAHPLESHLKVANMGMKTFRYEADGATPDDSNQAKSNSTTPKTSTGKRWPTGLSALPRRNAG